ncbi:MAG: alpha/beta fold hydrolase [Proteobacteria bacterium]|uniref:Alpha/beta fold hydrolase n=1 Tax=Candidatus Avisuccinivibrio stercorigallinarum TaxID=2840704 RepID=A0A9D9DBC0_9GAMM|nr:alpha/beta fold hydrolase [Candidatus Avisuccinivibrio stercorigallinarum]
MEQELKLGFKLTGDPKGQPLCLIHGWGLDSSFLTPIAKMFPEHCIYLIDLPGYGESRSSEQSAYDFYTGVEALYNIIPEGADVMAASLGSLFAIRALGRHQNPKAASLVTICSSARFPCDPNWPGLSAELFYRCRTLLTPRRCSRVLNLFVKMQLLDENHVVRDPKLMQLFEHYEVPSYQTLISGINTACFVDVREDLKNLKIPVLQLYGARDRFVPASLTYALKGDDLRTSYIFANSGHNPYLTEPKLFEKVVRDFFDKVHNFLA